LLEGHRLKSNRLLRVGEEIRKELALILSYKVSEFRGHILTVTEVRVSKDLQFADAWVSILGDVALQKKLFGVLVTDAYKFRMALAGQVYIRHLPELRFHLDRTLEEADKIDTLLRGSGVDFTKVESDVEPVG